MKTKDKKGMTLVEVIIAISIITIVLNIGYSILNKVNTSPKEQAIVSDIQNGMNNVRSLISKEVKYCEGIEIQYADKKGSVVSKLIGKNDGNLTEVYKIKQNIIDEISSKEELSYQYNILKDTSTKSENIESTYKIKITTKNNRKYFSIDKVDSKGIYLNLISRQNITENTLPMDISTEDDLYRISINYNNNVDKKYSFKVYSEFNPVLYSDNTDIPSGGNNSNIDIPSSDNNSNIDLPNENTTHIGNVDISNSIVLGYAISNIKSEGKIYTWISNNKEFSDIKPVYKSAYINDEKEFSISGDSRTGNNKGVSASISGKDSTSEVSKDISDKNISEISIYVSKHTILSEIKIEGKQSNCTILIPGDMKKIEGGNDGKLVKCIIDKKGDSKVNFSISGKLSLDENEINSGFAIVKYN